MEKLAFVTLKQLAQSCNDAKVLVPKVWGKVTHSCDLDLVPVPRVNDSACPTLMAATGGLRVKLRVSTSPFRLPKQNRFYHEAGQIQEDSYL